MDSAETPEVAPRRSYTPLWFVLACIAFSLVAVAGSCALVISRLNFDLNIGPLDLGNFNATPGRYKPIPVSTSACPYLRRVHDTADRSGQLWVATTFGSLAESKRGLVTVSLVEFDLALQRAMPHVPPAVQRQLHATLVQVRVGERALQRAASLSAYADGGVVGPAVTAGNTALGNASDLVGHVCGFRLEPVLDFGRLMTPVPATTRPVGPSSSNTLVQHN